MSPPTPTIDPRAELSSVSSRCRRRWSSVPCVAGSCNSIYRSRRRCGWKISINWRGRPLTDIRTIVELISATTTKTGLSGQATYDPNWYPTGQKLSDADYNDIPLHPHDWHGEWNYDIHPTPTAQIIPRRALSVRKSSRSPTVQPYFALNQHDEVTQLKGVRMKSDPVLDTDMPPAPLPEQPGRLRAPAFEPDHV